MIDALSFASNHNSFWAENTPTLENFIRHLNLEHTERAFPPINKPSSKIRASLVSELAFSRFCARISGNIPSHVDVISGVKKRLGPLIDDPKELEASVSSIEEEQANLLEKYLWSFFSRRHEIKEVRPIFNGCGYLDASEGDIISGKSIFEIKAVDRQFRGIDIKQLITYFALNHASEQFSLEKIGIFNPRRGVWFEIDFDFIALEVSGRSAIELCDRIVWCVSSGDISR